MKKVEGYIERKSMLYKTNVEYGDYAMNHVLGCAHGCKYPCYAYLMKKRCGQVNDYECWMKPYLVSNTLELLSKEIEKLRMNSPSNVQLCFTTDPFMYGYEEICQMSMQSIAMLNNAGIPCTVLTKGVLPYELSQLSPYNIYGITLVSLNEEYRRFMEPGAAPFADRIASLRRLHDAGCRTWVSMEPYPTPNIIEQDLQQILESISFVDRIIFGRTNYSTDVSGYKPHKEFYNAMAMQVIQFCENRGISYHIKDGTITNLPF